MRGQEATLGEIQTVGELITSRGESHFPLLSFPFPYFCWHPHLWPSAHWPEAGNWRPSSLDTANNSWPSATSKHSDQQIPQNSRSLSKNERNKTSKQRLTPSSTCYSRISKPLLAAPNIQRDTQGHPEEGCLRSRHLQFRTAHSTDEHRSNPVVLCPNLQHEHVGQKQLLPASLGKALFFLNFMKILQVSFF